MRVNQMLPPRIAAVVAVGYLVGLAAYPFLPGPFLNEKISAHLLVAFTLPTTALVIQALFGSLWTHDHLRSGNGAFEHTYRAIVFRVLLFVVALQALVMIELTGILRAAGVQIAAGRVVVVLLGGVMIAIGNLLPRTRPNVAVGLRTARTLGNDHLWQQVHRAGGYATVALGIVVAVTGVVLGRDSVGPVVSIAAFVAAVAVWASYRKHVRA